MATMDGDAILTRIRAVIEAGAGSFRLIATDRFDGGLWEDLDPEEQSKRATYRPIVEATITGQEPHESRPTVICNVGMIAIEVTIIITRHLGPEDKATDALRDNVKGLAADDADVLQQVLMYPGNLDRSTTGIVSGMLNWQASTLEVQLSDDAAGRILTEHTFTGIVQTAPA